MYHHLNKTFFSVQRATCKGSNVEFKENTAELRCNGTVFEIKKHGHLYFLNSALSSKKASHSLTEWHKILGHCNVKDVLKLESVVDGMKITDKSFVDCDVCIKSKMSDKSVEYLMSELKSLLNLYIVISQGR